MKSYITIKVAKKHENKENVSVKYSMKRSTKNPSPYMWSRAEGPCQKEHLFVRKFMDYSLLDASHTRISPRDDYYEGPIIQNTSNGHELWIDVIHRISTNSDQTEIHTLLKTRAGRRSPLSWKPPGHDIHLLRRMPDTGLDTFSGEKTENESVNRIRLCWSKGRKSIVL